MKASKPISRAEEHIQGLSFSLTPVDNSRLAELCGEHNAHLKQIEAHLSVTITHRAALFYVEGAEQDVHRTEAVIRKLYAFSATQREPIDAEAVHLALIEGEQPQRGASFGENGDRNGQGGVVIKVRKHQIRPRNAAQAAYLERILDNDINFGIGPAGTGKTYLAVACAASALASQHVERIVLVRPVVEAGEKLGFLPGDIGQKVDPYLRPLYDALYEMLGVDRVGKLMERGVIELAPLAYMRGRTLNSSFILLDEAQNTTVEQMKMFLTRMGYGSKVVVTGDISQIDLPKSVRSGLVHVQSVLQNIKGVSFTHFQAGDVVRHSLVQRIVEAYERQENADKSGAE